MQHAFALADVYKVIKLIHIVFFFFLSVSVSRQISLNSTNKAYLALCHSPNQTKKIHIFFFLGTEKSHHWSATLLTEIFRFNHSFLATLLTGDISL